MTLVDLPTLLPYPGFRISGFSAALSVAGVNQVDAAGEYRGAVLRAPRTGNIAAFGWLPGSVSGAGTVELRAESVGADGFPTGTLWDTNTNLTSIAPTSNTWRWDELTAPAAVTRGQLIAFSLLYESGTSVQVRGWNAQQTPYLGTPYSVRVLGAPLKFPNSMVGAIKYDDGMVEFCGLLPTSSQTLSVSIAETGTPDEVGAKIVLPMPCTVDGIGIRAGTAGRSFDLTLYDASDDVLATIASIDSDQSGDTIPLGMYLFGTPVNLAAGTYRATIAPKSGASTVDVDKVLVDASGTRGGWPGGTNVMWTERADAGAWTDTDTAIPIVDLLISQLDDGAGGGATFPVLAGKGGPAS